jgi:hypothetical protein
VTWSVQEGASGGAITPAGVYTAPNGVGTYHVVATSVADGTKTATATVTVATNLVTGTAMITYLTFNPTSGAMTAAPPTPWLTPANTIHGIKADGQTVLPGVYSQTTGNYSVPAVPAGYYWLSDGYSYIWTNLNSVNLDWVQSGRPNLALATNVNTNLISDLTGMTAWNANQDFLVFYDYNTNNYIDGMGGTGFPNNGDTTLALTTPWASYYLEDTTQGDAPVIEQLHSPTSAGEITNAVTGLYSPAPLTMANGTNATVTGGFVAPAQTTTFVNYSRSQFSAYRAEYNPNGTFHHSAFYEVDGLPGAAVYGDTNNWLDYMYIENTDPTVTTDLDLGSVPMPTLPLGYQPVYYAGDNFWIQYTAPGATNHETVKVRAIRAYQLTPPNGTQPLQPVLSPVKNLLINGLSAYSNQMGVGLTPTLAWTAPDLGTPTGYQVEIFQLYQNGANTNDTEVARLYFDPTQTSTQIPAGILQTGNAYYIQIQCWNDPAFNPLAAPWTNRMFPYARTRNASNMFMP